MAQNQHQEPSRKSTKSPSENQSPKQSSEQSPGQSADPGAKTGDGAKSKLNDQVHSVFDKAREKVRHAARAIGEKIEKKK